MPTEIVMPRLSDTMDSGTIAKWLKQEGDAIKRGEIIAEIETDKANMELESFANGVLAQILVPEGQSVALGQPIAVVAASAEEAQALKSSGPATSTPAPPVDAAGPNGPVAPSPTEAEPANVPAEEAPAQPGGSNGAHAPQGSPEPVAAGGRIKASPLARRMAQEHDINLADVSGTGPGGRVTKEDVQSFMRGSGASRPTIAPSSPPPDAAPALRAPAGGSGRAAQPVEMSRMQATIARRMVESKFSAPEFVLTSEVDMTEARALLTSIAGAEDAPKVGPNDLLIKAVATALSRHPEVNAGWENNAIVYYGRINMGFAVALPRGLVVPVVQDVNTKTLGQIATETKGLIERARTGKLAPLEYENGTFSISNLGMYGIDQFTPIINPPEACILGVGAIVKKPVVLDDTIVVRERLRLTLSCDHRVVYGADAAEFLRTLRRLLESPLLILL